MIQRCLAILTNALSWVVGGKVDNQYWVGSFSPRGHSISNHSSTPGNLPEVGRGKAHRQLLRRYRWMVGRTLPSPWRPSHLPSWLGGQWLFTGSPHRYGTLHSHDIGQLEFGEFVTKLGVHAIGRIRQNHAPIEVGRDGRPDLIQRDLRLGLKGYLFGYFGLFPPLVILGPILGQIESIRNGQTRTPGRYRQAHGHSAVFLF